MKDPFKEIAESYTQTESKNLLLLPALKRALKRCGASGKLLDVGCGTADMHNVVTKAGYKYFGFDISKNMLKKHDKNILRQTLSCSIVQFSANTIEKNSTLFSLILSWEP